MRSDRRAPIRRRGPRPARSKPHSRRAAAPLRQRQRRRNREASKDTASPSHSQACLKVICPLDCAEVCWQMGKTLWAPCHQVFSNGRISRPLCPSGHIDCHRTNPQSFAARKRLRTPHAFRHRSGSARRYPTRGTMMRTQGARGAPRAGGPRWTRPPGSHPGFFIAA